MTKTPQDPLKCPHCRGNGEVICPDCRGKGRIVCPKCSGKGRVTLAGGGLGRYADRTAYGGTVREEQCLACQGTGFQNARCPTCNGHGSLICSVCDGAKTVSRAVASDYRTKRRNRKARKGCGCLLAIIGVSVLVGIISENMPDTPSSSPQPSPTNRQPQPAQQPKTTHAKPQPDATLKPPSQVPVEVDTEPDWDKRYAELYRSYAERFSPPQTGQIVSIKLKSGSEFRGTLYTLDDTSLQVRLESGAIVGFENTQLDARSRVSCFLNDFATLYARRELEKEKKAR